MNAKDLWKAGLSAAEALAGVGEYSAEVRLGVGLPVEVLREVARLFGARTSRTLYAGNSVVPGPFVIESFYAQIGRIQVYAQTTDTPSDQDDRSRAFRAGEHSYVNLEDNKEVTP